MTLGDVIAIAAGVLVRLAVIAFEVWRTKRNGEDLTDARGQPEIPDNRDRGRGIHTPARCVAVRFADGLGRLRYRMVNAVDRAVAKIAGAHPRDTFYALAFHHGYAEVEGRIDPPAVALNSERSCAKMHPRAKGPHDFESVRWNPPDWEWDDLGAVNRVLERFYARLMKDAGSSTPRHWDRVYARYERMLVRVREAHHERRLHRLRAGRSAWTRGRP